MSTFAAFRLAEYFSTKAYDETLVRAADSIAARIKRNEKGVVVVDLPVAAQDVLRYGNSDSFYYQIADSRGHRLTGDAELPLPQSLDQKSPRFRYAQVNGEKIRLCRISLQVSPSDDEFFVQVAESLNQRRRFLNQIFLSILIPQLMLAALASGSVYIGVTSGLRPLEKLANLLTQRKQVDLSPVDIGRTPKELHPVITALNELFSRADRQMVWQKQFIGNAAHQMRTPLTALQTYVDHARRVLDAPSKGDVKLLLDQIAESTSRVTHLVSRLLSLARSEDDSPRNLIDIDMNAIATEAASSLVHAAISRDIDLELDLLDKPCEVSGHPGELAELLVNILENAILYTPQGGKVKLSVRENDPQWIVVQVDDSGTGIPDSEKSKIFDRFYRIEQSPASGCGLGLSIVQEIAEKHGILIDIDRSELGGSLFRLKLRRGASASR